MSWRVRAACNGDADPDTWFAADDDRTRQARARRICAACPVRPDCLAAALNTTPRPTGVWGGLSEHDRRVLVARLTKARRTAGRVGKHGRRVAVTAAELAPHMIEPTTDPAALAGGHHTDSTPFPASGAVATTKGHAA